MKFINVKVVLFLLLLCVHLNKVFAQAPDKMSFQQVIRTSGGVLVTGTTVGMRLSILQGSVSGTAVYVETQTPTTNANGLATLYIGNGTVVSGSIDSINWGAGPFYLKSETDPAGGTSYSITASQQLVSVPYALYAANAGSGGGSGTSGTRPTVTTDSATHIAYTTCTIYGTAVSCGSELLIYRGFCIDTTLMPDIATSPFIAVGYSIGSFSLNVTGLLSNTHYHARAFASNSVGTSYGDTLSFTTRSVTTPTVVTDSIFGVTTVSASGNGTVTSDGGRTVTNRGICYDTFPMPTTSSHVSMSGTGIGLFSTTLAPLASAHTYYVRAYAVNAMGTSYGSQDSFTTVLSSVPSILTDSASSVSYSTAVSGVHTLSAGGYSIIAQGVCWSTSPYPTTSSYFLGTTAGVGDFPVTISGLTAGTTYYVRAYSINSLGTAYGEQITFTTLPLSLPTVSTNTIIGITTTTATSGGHITATGGSTISANGVCWSLTSPPTVDSSHTSDATTGGVGFYNSNLTGLNPHTTYFVAAYATNATGTAYGSVASFTTDSLYMATPTVPVVGTDSPLITSSSTASSGGVVTIDGGSTVTARGICWGTSPYPTTSGSHTTDGSGLGYFTSIATSLSGCATIYYVRAYATNSTGTGYGNQYIVSTGLKPVITTTPATSISTTGASSGGNVTADGGCPVLYRGICYIPAVYDSPTITRGYVDTVGSGTGSYTATMSGLGSNVHYYVRAYATNSVGTSYGAVQSFTTLTPSSLYIGEPYAGGLIFYLDSTHLHGMVCASSDFTGYLAGGWGCQGIYISGTDTTFGSGAENTAAIIAECTDTTIAAYYCSSLRTGGYDDWFLPSLGEYNSMNSNLLHIGVGGLGLSRWYVTSSQVDATWYDIIFTSFPIPVYTESVSEAMKAYTTSYFIRPIRRF